MKQKIILARWFEGRPNWGDALNPVIIEHISGIKPVNLCSSRINLKKISQFLSLSPLPEYIVVGSTIAWGSRRDNTAIIWGAGFIAADEKVRSRPRKVTAVRGKLSRQRLLEQDIDCPEIFGDPALLFPRFYYPDIPKTHNLGIIPHYSDVNTPWLKHIAELEEVKIIDITSDVYSFIDNLLSCEQIASSSLHGVIAADAYGIPSLWIKLSDAVKGNGFKFRDYFSSVNVDITLPFVVEEKTTLGELQDSFKDYTIDIDLDLLYENCPFKPEP